MTRLRLSLLSFMEFGVWGAYLTSMGAYLSSVGMGENISYFYAAQGFVSLCMPALMGIIADRWVPAQRMLSACHAISGLAMCMVSYYCYSHAGNIGFAPLFCLYSLAVAFFMPTIALSNSVAYTVLDKAGKDPVNDFPSIRIFGTIGFIITMLTVDWCGLQFTPGQFAVSGILSLVLALYALSMPHCPCSNSRKRGFIDAFGLRAFTLFRNSRIAVFFCFSILLGAALQITNGYANPFISSFGANPLYQGTFGVEHANTLISLSQMSETLCILLIPFFLKRYGIKIVVLTSMIAWSLRFAFFGLGNPGNGVWLLILSMVVYGIAFDFFNISGSLFINNEVPNSIRSSAQGLFMLMTNGLGASIGTLLAGMVFNHFTHTEMVNGVMYTVGDWQTCWYIFAAYSLVIALLFALLFKAKPIE